MIINTNKLFLGNTIPAWSPPSASAWRESKCRGNRYVIITIIIKIITLHNNYIMYDNKTSYNEQIFMNNLQTIVPSKKAYVYKEN